MIKNMVLLLESHSSPVIVSKNLNLYEFSINIYHLLDSTFYIGAASLKENEFWFQRFVEIKILSFFTFPIHLH